MKRIPFKRCTQKELSNKYYKVSENGMFENNPVVNKNAKKEAVYDVLDSFFF